jgi:aspartate racemase
VKTIGLLGGMSWESTVSYYQVLNREVGRILGGLHSARVLMLSVDFQGIETLQHEGKWGELGEMLAGEAKLLQSAGADFLVLATNTMHLVVPAIEKAISIPVLHIADATAQCIGSSGIRRVGLLGTRFTMEEPFYRGRLEDRHGLEVLVPPPEDREIIHSVIYDELVLGKTLQDSRREYLRIVADLESKGAEGVILGCTEIGLLIGQGDTPLPLFDTARIHAEAAAELAVS